MASPSRPVGLLVLASSLIAGLSAGTTLSAFSDSTTSGGNTFSAAETFAISYVSDVGQASCGDDENALTLATRVELGDTIIGVLVLRAGVTGAISVADSKGNSWQTDADRTNSNVRTVVVSSRVTAALEPGDLITASHPGNGDARAFSAAVFRGITSGSRVDAAATSAGTSATPSVSITTTQTDDLLVGVAGNQNERSYTDPPGWSAMADISTGCGGARGRATLHAAYRIAPSSGTFSYAPSLSPSDRWAAALVAYRR